MIGLLTVAGVTATEALATSSSMNIGLGIVGAGLTKTAVTSVTKSTVNKQIEKSIARHAAKEIAKSQVKKSIAKHATKEIANAQIKKSIARHISKEAKKEAGKKIAKFCAYNAVNVSGTMVGQKMVDDEKKRINKKLNEYHNAKKDGKNPPDIDTKKYRKDIKKARKRAYATSMGISAAGYGAIYVLPDLLRK